VSHTRARVALVQRVVPHYNLIFYQKLLASSRHDWEFVYGNHAGRGESGLATNAEAILPTRTIRNVEIGKALWQAGVTRWVRERRYEAVVFELGWQIVSNSVVVSVAHQVGAVAIPWTKGISESGRPRPAWRRRIERAFIRNCDALLAYGHVSADYFVRYGYPRERIFVAQNTVDVREIARRIPAAQAGAATLRKRLDLQGRLVFGYLGRLVSQKRVDWIIDAFVDARTTGLDAVLIIAGDGPNRGALESRANTSRCAEAIFFCGRVPESQVDAYFEIFDIFISAYSAGLAILEAMAHAKVVVTTPENRPETEMVRDGITGFVTVDYSVAALADGLRRAAVSVHSGQPVGQRAQETVLSNATMENMVDAFDRAISFALEARARR